MLEETATVVENESQYNDLLGLELMVPCCTWDEEEAIKCWGTDYSTKTARGVVQKITLHRKTKQPRFEILFPEKRYRNCFVGYDLEYVMTYCEEVPLRYHKQKAEQIMKNARKAELTMLTESSASKSAVEVYNDSGTESDTTVVMRKVRQMSSENAKMPPTETPQKANCTAKNKKKTTLDPAPNSAPKKKDLKI
jgi:hypothetical protein